MKTYLLCIKSGDPNFIINKLYEIIDPKSQLLTVILNVDEIYVPTWTPLFNKYFKVLTESDIRLMKLTQLNKNK